MGETGFNLSLDVVALIVSVVSVFASFILTKIELAHNDKTNSLNLENEYFRKVFTDFMVNNVPSARSALYVTESGILSGKQALINELHNIMKQSLYYKYADYEFYDKMCDKIQELEDFLVDGYNEIDSNSITDMIDSYIESIYLCLHNRYQGDSMPD